MYKAHKPAGFELLRSRLGAREEVQVGAYARRQLRRRILVGVFGAALVAGAVALYSELRPAGPATAVGTYPVRVRCVSCGFTTSLRVPPEQTFPMECPRCRELTCRPLWRCRDCDSTFVPERTGATVRCPECGSLRVGSAAAP